ncbi:MAG: ArnT family glycosyltransferase [Owenweeksia sp.]
MKQGVNNLLLLIVSALFLIIAAPSLFSDGMFSDGLLYAALSRNMADGIGSFWTPHLSDSFFPEFYEHPPLAFGLQSLWFSLFGNSFLVERFYSLFTCALTGWVILLMWKDITGSYLRGWIPLFFWISIPTVSWSCANNMLENNLAVFVVLAAWLYLKHWQRNTWWLIILSGTALCLSALTKGLVGLYIWALPFFAWLIFRQKSFGKMVLETLLLIGLTALPVLAFYMYSGAAAENFTFYFTKQVITGSQKVATVDSRFAIIWEFLQQTLAPLLLAIIIIGINFLRRKTETLTALKENKKMVWLFVLIVLAGVLPIMISIKQRGYYIVPVFPFFAIAMGLLIEPLLRTFFSNLKKNQLTILHLVSALLVIAALVIGFTQSKRIGRDQDKLSACLKTIELTGKNRHINVVPEFYEESSYHGYFARYGNVSLFKRDSKQNNYYLTPKQQGNPPGCNSMDIGSEKYSLFFCP